MSKRQREVEVGPQAPPAPKIDVGPARPDYLPREQESQPAPVAAEVAHDVQDEPETVVLESQTAPVKRQKQKTLPFEQLYIDALPSADMYEKSFMHRDTVTHVATTKTDFVVTASKDGHVKFWKKKPEGIEFVKHFKAHLKSIVGMSASADGELICTSSNDNSFKVFDVVNFDMINMVRLPFTPGAVAMIHKEGVGRGVVAIADRNSSSIYIYQTFDPTGKNDPIKVLDALHGAAVQVISYNSVFNTVVSVDTSGQIEYWDASTYDTPSCVTFQYKMETDLFELQKKKTFVTSASFSRDGKMFACMGKDKIVRVFRFLSGKLYRAYDESLKVCNTLQKSGSVMYHLDDIDFGRRVAVEKELDNTEDAATSNVVFDDSGNFIIYATMFGIKVVNMVTNRVVKLLGKVESTDRFLNIALYQGKPRASMVTGKVETAKEEDPTLVCTSFKRQRLYLFTRREPDSADAVTTESVGRDVWNERPTREETAAAPVAAASKKGGRLVILHTSLGDIHIEVHSELVPKTSENFITLCKRGYYDGLIFHRVIKGFMLQTGDPLGDGTGGESMWHKYFDDEFHPTLSHDKPFTVAMANAGPNTNGSQFYITCAPTPWLNKKHSVFGQVTKGFEVVRAIEKTTTGANDRPVEDIKIVSATVE
eukprot:TRINITY_DN13311_c0_g1_i1.p1 TRINITY_DN13311_c0_g1~~TRINITY_DN13311_c0_g1_i1.p1  ORF type:complete len:651 (-),score=160.11 TRINITY_DN13311_c0_g1_i1:17-1969(-)